MITKNCKYCNKEITGYTEMQTNHMLNQHLLSAHRDKVEIREKKK